jgi:hypothetical protein
LECFAAWVHCRGELGNAVEVVLEMGAHVALCELLVAAERQRR